MKRFTLYKIVKKDMEEYFSYLIPDDNSFNINNKVKVEQDKFDRVYLDAKLVSN
jgi:hypothetical protein